MIGGAVGLFFGIGYALKSSEPYQLTMQSIRADPRVQAAIGEDLQDARLIGGQVHVSADGTGEARFNIPVSGSKGNGTAISHATRQMGKWNMRLIVVLVDGSEVPIVLVNEDNVSIPDAPLDV